MDNKLLIVLLVAFALLIYGCTAQNGGTPGASGPDNGAGVESAPSAPAPSGALAPATLPGSNDSLINGQSSVDTDPTANLTSDSSLPDAPQ